MKIDFAGVPLCTGERMDSPKGFSIRTSINVQVSEPLRAVEAIMRDRMNAKTDVEFSLTRSHGTIQEAELFTLMHRASLANKGTLVLSADDGSHRNVKVVYLAGAALENCEVKYNGMLSVATYSFKGGRNQRNKPTT